MLERGTKVMSAIHKRLHFAQKKEFRLLANIFAKSLPPSYPYEVVGGPREIKQIDFDNKVDIIPVSDPNIFSMSQRVMLAQQQLQMATQAPQIHNMREAFRRMYEALEVENIDSILPPPMEVPPRDPISEQQAALTGQPIQAFVFQDHGAYIAAHSAFLQNPMVAQNPQAQAVIGANIQEHLAFQYKQQIEQVLGQPLPDLPSGQMPPEIMNQIAGLAAQAAQVVTGQQQAMAQAQQNAQIDPIVQLKREELAQKSQSDTLRAQVDQAKIESSEAIAEMKIAQDREEAMMKQKADLAKSYSEILKQVREADLTNRN
jgi:hypothetical protein